LGSLIAITADGKKVYRGTSATITVPIGGANQPVTIRIEGVKRISYVLGFRLSLNPPIQATPCNYKVGQTPLDANVVGLTVVCGAGTSLVVEADVIESE